MQEIRSASSPAPQAARAASPLDLRLSGPHSLLWVDTGWAIRLQAQDAVEAIVAETAGGPSGGKAPDASAFGRAASLVMQRAAGSLPVLRLAEQPAGLGLVSLSGDPDLVSLASSSKSTIAELENL